MNILAVETSYEAGFVALSFEGRTFVEVLPDKREQAKLLLFTIDALLNKAGATLAQIDRFVLAAGPGSFMGVRLAAASLQPLAFIHQKPIVAVSTLALLAASARKSDGVDEVFVCTNAYMNEVYSGHYCFDGRSMKPVSPDALKKPEALQLQAGVYVGDGVSLLKQAVKTIVDVKIDPHVMLEESLHWPEVSAEKFELEYLRRENAWRKN